MVIPVRLNENQEAPTEEQGPETGLTGVNLLAEYFTPILTGDRVTFAPKANIADLIDANTLKLVGQRVKEGADADLESMSEWIEGVEFGKELVKQETKTRNDPWEGAANYKTPVLMNAALRFSDPTTTQILRARDLVKASTIGVDPDGQKADRARRIVEFSNYQLNVEMPEWREEHEKLLYDLPYTGTVFKKTFFDAEKGRNISNLICFPGFAVSQEAKSLSRLPRFSEFLEFRENEIEEKRRHGIWLDVGIAEDGDTGDAAPTDKPREFIEQQGFYDLDADGYEEPYTFIVHANTNTVVRIIPRFEPENVLVRTGNVTTTLAKLIETDELSDHANIVRINSEFNVTKYGFLKDPQGGFLDVGYSHLLGALSSAINTTTNQLLDSGTLANLSGGYVAKRFRMRMGDLKLRPGYWVQTGLSPQDLQNGMLPHPNKEPSQTLFALNQMLIGSAQELSASADIGAALGPQTAPTTALTIVDEQLQKTGAIILRIYRAMAQEFQKLYKLNAKFLDPNEYRLILDDPEANFRDDFNQRDMDVIPVANPEISSKIQRIQMAAAEISQLESVAAAGGDIRPIVKNFFDAIGTQNIEEIFPNESPLEQLQRLFNNNPDLAELVMQEKDRLDLIAAAQADAFEKAEQREDLRLAAELDESEAKIDRDKAETVKKLEEAETEHAKNQIDVYTAALNLDGLDLQNQRTAQELINDNKRRLPTVEASPRNEGDT